MQFLDFMVVLFLIFLNHYTVFHNGCTSCPFPNWCCIFQLKLAKQTLLRSLVGSVSFSVTRSNPHVGKGCSFLEVQGMNSLPSKSEPRVSTEFCFSSLAPLSSIASSECMDTIVSSTCFINPLPISVFQRVFWNVINLLFSYLFEGCP